jgi:hypothetical protein
MNVWTSRCVDLSECILDSARRVLDRHMAKLREREDREMWMAMRLRHFVSTRSLTSRVLKSWRASAANSAQAQWLCRGSLLQV